MSDVSHGPEQGAGAAPGHGDGHGAGDEGGQGIHVERWEGIWMRISVAMVVVFILAIVISATAFGIGVPGVSGRVNPAELNNADNPFSQPGLRELAPGKYEAYIVAQTWSFMPDKIQVPVGSEVTFHMTARDVTHGFKLTGTNINMMVLPGQISTLSATFDKPGVYNYICHEYCGYVAGAPIGHHTMYGQLLVMPPHALTETVILTDPTGVTVTIPAEVAPVTSTSEVTATTEVTAASEVTATTEVTATAEVTATSEVTATAPVTAATELTATTPVTAAAPVTATGDVTATTVTTE